MISCTNALEPLSPTVDCCNIINDLGTHVVCATQRSKLGDYPRGQSAALIANGKRAPDVHADQSIANGEKSRKPRGMKLSMEWQMRVFNFQHQSSSWTMRNPHSTTLQSLRWSAQKHGGYGRVKPATSNFRHDCHTFEQPASLQWKGEEGEQKTTLAVGFEHVSRKPSLPVTLPHLVPKWQ